MKDLLNYHKVYNRKKFQILDSQFTRLTDAKGMGDLIKCAFITKEEVELIFF